MEGYFHDLTGNFREKGRVCVIHNFCKPLLRLQGVTVNCTIVIFVQFIPSTLVLKVEKGNLDKEWFSSYNTKVKLQQRNAMMHIRTA